MKKLLSDPPLKCDELDLVEIVMTLEERFHVEIPDRIFRKHVGGKLGKFGEAKPKVTPSLLVAIIDESLAQDSSKGK